jgi:3-oxoacyl-[acyl-carrier protein] reductase
MQPGSLAGKNCLITAATGGLGEQIARSLARQGCNLFLTSRTAAKLQQLSASLVDMRVGDALFDYAVADLSVHEQVGALIESAKARMGQIDILINCAGIFVPKSLDDLRLEDFELSFHINVRAPFLLTKAFAPDMVRNGWGRIVNIASSSAYAGFRDTSVYCASKHALLGFSRSIYQELKQHNVRTFCVSPGSIKSEMGRQVRNQNFETFIDPQEIAEYITFMIAFDSAMISEEVRLNRLQIQ